MIKEIEIINFESHEHTVYHLSAGLNVFRGGNDSGKSSGLRAVSVCAYNMWDESMVRIGTKFCEIKVTTDRGSVYTKRGGNKNEWKIQELNEDGTFTDYAYSKIGKTVPEVATRVLGMPQVSFGGVSDTPNMMFQLDKHYMLSEIDGKKCSPNTVAQMVDEMLGLNGAEKLITDIGNDGRKSKLTLSNCEEKISELVKKLHDPDMLVQCKTIIEQCRKLTSLYEKLKIKKERLRFLSVQYLSVKDKQKQVECELKKFVDLPTHENLYKTLKEKFQYYTLLKQKKYEYDGLVEKHKTIVTKLERLKTVSECVEKMANLKLLQSKYENMFRVNEQFSKVSINLSGINRKLITYSDLSDMSKMLFELKNQYALYVKYEEVYRNYSIINTKNRNINGLLVKIPSTVDLVTQYESVVNLHKRFCSLTEIHKNRKLQIEIIRKLDEKIISVSGQLNKLLGEREEFFKTNPNCPLCGTLFKESSLCQ